MDKIYRYFSQNGEDYLLCKFFEFKEKGFFVDVGAFDGVHLSNSYCFELLGWQGICVEPQNFYHQRCVKNRPLSTCINAACVDDDSIKEITLSTDSTGLFSGVDLSNEQKNIKDHYRTLGKELPSHKTETVPAATLDSILNKHLPEECNIDFISIDVEGLEKKVLDGLDLSRFTPHLLLVETGNDADQDELTEYLKPHGYMFARRLGPNSFFARSQQDIDTINEIEVTCILEKQMHPLGREFTQKIFLDGKIIYKEMNGNSMLLNYEKLEQLIEERNKKVSELLGTIDSLNTKLRAPITKKLFK